MANEWTEDMVRAHCGFKPWGTFVKEHCKALAHYADQLNNGDRVEEFLLRGCGRTKRMLFKAVAAAGNGHRVAIVGHDHNYERDLVMQAREMAKQCGIDEGLIGFRPAGPGDAGGRTQKGPPAHVYLDHHQIERIFTKG